jgi:transcriptional regulator with XRE-family HTH domain
MNNRRKTTDAVRILHRRYIGEDVQRQASLEQERMSAEVARTIYELREHAGLSQKELAERVETTQSVISRLEDADYEGHSLSMLNRIAKALNQQITVVVRPNPRLANWRAGAGGISGTSRGGARQRELNPKAKTEDWEGNNIAVTCPNPACCKVYIVSARIHGGKRSCPSCGKSEGTVEGGRKSGGKASISWSKEDRQPQHR